jgi:hypothetical protein
METFGRPFGIDRMVLKEASVEIDFTWAEVGDIAPWHLVMGGGDLTVTTSGTENITDEQVSLSAAAWAPLLHSVDFVTDSTVTVHDAAGGGAEFIQDADYYLDRRGGHVRRMPGSAITEGQTVFVDYQRQRYSGRSFHPWEGDEAEAVSFRLTKPLTGGDVLRITHSRAVFSGFLELPLASGRQEGWAGVKSGVRFLKDTGGAYGPFGRWEIYTP